MITYASTLHVTWAFVSLIGDGTALRSTALSGVANIFGRTLTPWMLLTVAFLAMSAFTTQNRHVRFFLMIPQQSILFMSVCAALMAIWLEHYADGVPRPWPFIMADQMPTLIAAVCYTVAVVMNVVSCSIIRTWP